MKPSDLYKDIVLFEKVGIDINRAFEIWISIEIEKQISEQKEVA